jgi:hypothetical protein
MDIQFIDEVYSILDKVKEETGKGFEFIGKDDLPTHAGLKMARKDMPSHIIVYRKKYDEVINHLVAHECGHILRMFKTPEEKRIIPYSDDEIKLSAIGQIETEIVGLSKILPFERLTAIVNLWYNGIVRQVTNHPPDIMIEKWLFNDYPGIRTLQRKSLENQLKESLAGLNDSVIRITPKTILDASNIMNYTFFRLLGLHFGTNFIRPYNNTIYVSRGKELAAITEKEYVDTYEGDIQMANRWAQFLGLEGWFKWRDFEDVPGNYKGAN